MAMLLVAITISRALCASGLRGASGPPYAFNGKAAELRFRDFCRQVEKSSKLSIFNKDLIRKMTRCDLKKIGR